MSVNAYDISNADNIFMERLSRRIYGVGLGRVCSNTVFNYWDWGRKTKEKNDGFRCPAERLNGKRYADNWLENLLVATSVVPKTKKPPLKTA